jgi:tetratricopeptide (TPR) repeat protein
MAPPKVFISYSHDSQKHKKWVLDLATSLRNSGVDAIMDQWDLGPGDDLPQFMETLNNSDYVVMVCTEKYVKKANAGTGGVGYEKMIISAGLLANIDSNKILPLIRQSGSQNMPTFLKTKIFVDFSKDDNYELSFDKLVRTLLDEPILTKPEIGNNLFTKVREIQHEKVKKITSPSIDASANLEDYVKYLEERIQTLQKKNNFVELIKKIQTYLNLNSYKFSSSDLTTGKLRIRDKDYNKAKEVLEREVAKNPESFEGFYLLGYLNAEEDDYNSMVKNFDKSLALNNKFEKNISDSRKYKWQNNFNKGVRFFNQGTKVTDIKKSKILFNKSVEKFEYCNIIETATLSSYQNMFYAMINAGRSERELEYPLLKIIELSNTPEAYIDLSKVYNSEALVLMNSFEDTKNLDDKTKAMAIYDKVITLLEKGRKLNPDNSGILAHLSNAYVDANKLNVAMATFQKGIETDPENEVYHYNYGVLLLSADDYDSASTQFQKAIDIKTDYTSAYYNLGVTYLKWGADLQEQAIAADSEDITYKEKFELAVIHFEKYLVDNPEDANIWNYLGKVYKNLGQIEKSIKSFDNEEALNAKK